MAKLGLHLSDKCRLTTYYLHRLLFISIWTTRLIYEYSIIWNIILSFALDYSGRQITCRNAFGRHPYWCCNVVLSVTIRATPSASQLFLSEGCLPASFISGSNFTIFTTFTAEQIISANDLQTSCCLIWHYYAMLCGFKKKKTKLIHWLHISWNYLFFLLPPSHV